MKTAHLISATIRGTTWLSSDGIRGLLRRGKAWIAFVAGAGILVALGSLMAFLVVMYRGLLSLGAAAGHPQLLLFYAVLISWVFVFLESLPLALSVLYYARDTQMLLPLPLRPVEIVAAKAALLYLYALPVSLFLTVPAIVVYASHIGFSASFALWIVLNLFVSPVVPLTLAIILMVLLAKAVNLSRYRVALEVVGMGLGIVLILAVQVAVSRTIGGSYFGGSPPGIGQLPDLYGALERGVPPVAWFGGAFVVASGTISAVLALLTAAACAGIVFVLAPAHFLIDTSVMQEIIKGRRTMEAGELRAPTRRSALWRIMMGREWAVLSSNSTFVFEAIAELLILPLILGIYGLILPKQQLGAALAFINASPLMGLILLAVLVLMTNLTTVSSTSLSREGRLFGLSLTIPVPGRTQLLGKMALQLMLFLPAYFVDLILVYVLFRLPLSALVYLIPAGPVFQVFGFMAGVVFDVKRPFLKWTHPQQAMKNNTNAYMGMVGMLVLVVGLAIPAVILLIAGASTILIGVVVLCVPLALDLILLPRLLALADRQYGGGLETA